MSRKKKRAKKRRGSAKSSSASGPASTPAPAPGTANDPDDPDDPAGATALLAEAEDLFAQERLAEAEALLEQALAQTGGTAEILNNLGVLATAQGQSVKARERFQAALDKEPENGDALINLGDLEQAAGNLDQALHCFKRCLLAKKEEQSARQRIESLLRERAARGERRLLLVLGGVDPKSLLPAVRAIRTVEPLLQASVLVGRAEREKYEASGVFERVLVEPDTRFYEFLFYGGGSSRARKRFGDQLAACCAGEGSVPEGPDLDPVDQHMAIARVLGYSEGGAQLGPAAGNVPMSAAPSYKIEVSGPAPGTGLLISDYRPSAAEAVAAVSSAKDRATSATDNQTKEADGTLSPTDGEAAPGRDEGAGGAR